MKAILLLLIFASSSLANDFSIEAPNGSVYDTRTYYYDKNKQKVIVRPKFANLTNAERHDLFGMPDARKNPKWIAAKQEWEKELAKRRVTRIANAQEKARRPTIVYRYYPIYYPIYYSSYQNYSRCYDNRDNFSGLYIWIR